MSLNILEKTTANDIVIAILDRGAPCSEADIYHAVGKARGITRMAIHLALRRAVKLGYLSKQNSGQDSLYYIAKNYQVMIHDIGHLMNANPAAVQ